MTLSEPMRIVARALRARGESPAPSGAAIEQEISRFTTGDWILAVAAGLLALLAFVAIYRMGKW
jgi:hypothetical protein